MKKKFQTYCFKDKLNPTRCNIARVLEQYGFKSTDKRSEANFSDQNLGSELPFAEILEQKHLLSGFVNQHCRKIMPFTRPINDYNYITVIKGLLKKQRFNLFFPKELRWILKPSLLNNGEHIHLFNTLQAVMTHYQQNKRLGGEHVLQEYINPHLYDKKKYSIRMFVILTNYQGAYLYQQGYLNICTQDYRKEFTDDLLSTQLTSPNLFKGKGAIRQEATDDFFHLKLINKHIRHCTREVLWPFYQLAKEEMLAESIPAFDIFGFDFMLDNKKKLKLLEINHGPHIPRSLKHALANTVFQPFFHNLTKKFILPMTLNEQPKVSDSDFGFLRLV